MYLFNKSKKKILNLSETYTEQQDTQFTKCNKVTQQT